MLTCTPSCALLHTRSLLPTWRTSLWIRRKFGKDSIRRRFANANYHYLLLFFSFPFFSFPTACVLSCTSFIHKNSFFNSFVLLNNFATQGFWSRLNVALLPYSKIKIKEKEKLSVKSNHKIYKNLKWKLSAKNWKLIISKSLRCKLKCKKEKEEIIRKQTQKRHLKRQERERERKCKISKANIVLCFLPTDAVELVWLLTWYLFIILSPTFIQILILSKLKCSS